MAEFSIQGVLGSTRAATITHSREVPWKDPLTSYWPQLPSASTVAICFVRGFGKDEHRGKLAASREGDRALVTPTRALSMARWHSAGDKRVSGSVGVKAGCPATCYRKRLLWPRPLGAVRVVPRSASEQPHAL